MHNPPLLAAQVAAARLHAVSINDIIFRSVHLAHFANFATVQPLRAAHGGPTGSRYIPPNGPRALYASLDAETAYRELNQHFYQALASPAGPALLRAGGLRPNPTVLLALHIRATQLLDLRDPVIHQLLGIHAAGELLGPWRFIPNAPTQTLGEVVFNDGQFEGILFPSSQNTGHNCILFFPDRRLPASRIDFVDSTTELAARLP